MAGVTAARAAGAGASKPRARKAPAPAPETPVPVPATPPEDSPAPPTDQQENAMGDENVIEDQAGEAEQAPVAPQVEPVRVMPIAMPVDAIAELMREKDAGSLAQVGIQVTGPAQGRWRAGRSFGLHPIIIPLVNLDEDALRAIDANPLLSWAVAQVPVADGTVEGDVTEGDG